MADNGRWQTMEDGHHKKISSPATDSCEAALSYKKYILKWNEFSWLSSRLIFNLDLSCISTYIVLFPDIITALLVLDELIVLWLAATEYICEGFRKC